MKTLSLLLIATLLTACSEPVVKVELDFAGQRLTDCPAATLSPLKEGQQPSGFKLICASPRWQMYFITDTRKLKDQRVNQLEFMPPPETPDWLKREFAETPYSHSQTWRTAVHSSKLGKIPCPSAQALKREGGEAPIPQGLTGSLSPGEYHFELAKPCGQLTVRVKS